MAAVLAGIATCVLAFALTDSPAATVPPGAPAATVALTTAPPPAAKPAVRRIYPYSVLPGGVATRAELVRIVRSDKVVAAHYADFQVDQARPLTVRLARAVHVSYRKGDKVYWTAKKVMLREGETLLSDGRNEMRARCANRISDVARFPVEADAPSPELLDVAFEETLDAPADVGLYGALLMSDAPALDDAESGAGQQAGTAGSSQPAAASGLPLAFPSGPASPAHAMRSATARQVAGFDGAGVLPPARGTAPPVVASATPDTDPPGAIPPLALPPSFVGIPVDTSDLDPFVPKPGADGAPPPVEPARETPPAEVPEPGSAWLVLAALLALAVLRK